jgi:hypothetical protein
MKNTNFEKISENIEQIERLILDCKIQCGDDNPLYEDLNAALDDIRKTSRDMDRISYYARKDAQQAK